MQVGVGGEDECGWGPWDSSRGAARHGLNKGEPLHSTEAGFVPQEMSLVLWPCRLLYHKGRDREWAGLS